MASPLAIYQTHLDRGELAYQVSADGRAVFFPRVVAPRDGGPLTWKVSKGRGVVYACTTVFRRGESALNVAIIEMDEGFRLMSRVEGIPAEEIAIGMRVKLRVQAGTTEEPAIPLFVSEST